MSELLELLYQDRIGLSSHRVNILGQVQSYNPFFVIPLLSLLIVLLSFFFFFEFSLKIYIKNYIVKNATTTYFTVQPLGSATLVKSILCKLKFEKKLYSHSKHAILIKCIFYVLQNMKEYKTYIVY